MHGTELEHATIMDKSQKVQYLSYQYTRNRMLKYESMGEEGMENRRKLRKSNRTSQTEQEERNIEVE